MYVIFVFPLLDSGSAEVNLPVDRFTKKIKGFARIKFSPPENAVKALADLDGSVFQVCCRDVKASRQGGHLASAS